MARGLTIKQRKFVKGLIASGNGTRAALEAYKTSDPKVAKVIASENLTKPNVRKVLEDELAKVGLSDRSVCDLLKKATIAGLGVKAKNSDSLRGIELMLKLKGAFPARKSPKANLTVYEKLNSLGDKEVWGLFKRQRLKFQKLVEWNF